MKPPKLVLELPEDMSNSQLVSAHLAVASLTIAWHYILNVPNHDKAAELIEVALEGAVQLRERLK